MSLSNRLDLEMRPLLGYLLAPLFACFGVAYRSCTWVERLVTRMYFRHKVGTLLSPTDFKAIPHMAVLALDQIPCSGASSSCRSAAGAPL